MAPKNIDEAISKLRSEITTGKLPYGSLLPSEKELASGMKLSRPTVAKIYNKLKEEGLVRKTPGLGTTVIFNGSRKKHPIGLLLPGAGESEIFGPIHDHFLAIEKESEVKFLRDGAIGNDAEIRQNSILKICENYVDVEVRGVLFAPLERTSTASIINRQVCQLFEKKGIPLILIDRDISFFPERSAYCVIGLDNFSAGYTMTKHLIEAGCERIYFFYRSDSANSIYKRIAGCTSACFEHEISFRKEHIIVGDPADLDLIRRIEVVPKKTGILCANDSTAAVAISSLKALGIMISKHVLIAGFDDMKYGKVLHPSLTTYRQPLSEIAKVSYRAILNQVLNPYTIPGDISMVGELIARESSKFEEK